MSNAPASPASVVELLRSDTTGAAIPQVYRQTGSRQIEVSGGSALALGSWLLCGDQIGIVGAHRAGRAIVDLVFERSHGRWGQIRTAARIGMPVVPVPPGTWADLYSAHFDSPFAVGRVRQDQLDCEAMLPALEGERMVVTGMSGSGKSTAITSALVAFRRALETRRISSADRPAVVVFDAHGDYLGRVRDEGGTFRPNLLACLDEVPVVLGEGSLTCHVRDLPPSLLVRALGKLSPAQTRWADSYAIDDSDHTGIEHLIFDRFEPEWATLFPDLAVNGEMAKTQRESLRTLRTKIRALLAPPLFVHDTASSWRVFFERVYAGRVSIIDVTSYPRPQQTLLIVLVILAIQRHQEAVQREGGHLKPILVVADELHRFPGAYERFAGLALEGRKFRVGTIVGSQRLAHVPDDVLMQATSAIVMRLEGSDIRSAVNRWPELRAVASELGRLRAGDGYYVSNNTPWPLHFDEPEPSSAGRRRAR